ncbi:MAG: glycosyltransferase family 4 protein [Segetibacter sp.]
MFDTTDNNGEQHMKSISIAGHRDARIHVLEVIGNAGQGGMENYIENFIAHLPANQYKLTCICPYESPFTASLRLLGVENVYITPITDDPAWRSIQLTVEVARLHQIDVLHAHMPKAHILAGLSGCLIRKPVVATLHGMNISSQELGITRAVGSHLITNCAEGYTQALAMGVLAERVNLVRNGVDTAMFTPDRTGDKLRNQINVSRGTPLVGFVGRLEHEKGPDLFLRAVDQVHQVRPDVHFVIAGDGVMRNKLEEMCAHLQLDKYVHFVGWWTNTVDIYPALDFLVHTSRSDGTSLVLLEAMSCGCPTVGLAVGGVPEIIENERTGFLAGAGDWEGIAFRIIQLLDQPNRLQSMKAAARERVKQHFDVGTNTRRIAELMSHIAFPDINGHGFASNSTMPQEIDSRASF